MSFFALSFAFNIIDIDCNFVINLCVVRLVNAHDHLISSNTLCQKLVYKVKYIGQINGER